MLASTRTHTARERLISLLSMDSAALLLSLLQEDIQRRASQDDVYKRFISLSPNPRLHKRLSCGGLRLKVQSTVICARRPLRTAFIMSELSGQSGRCLIKLLQCKDATKNNHLANNLGGYAAFRSKHKRLATYSGRSCLNQSKWLYNREQRFISQIQFVSSFREKDQSDSHSDCSFQRQ